MFYVFFATVVAASAAGEQLLPLPNGGFVGLSTRGSTSFRVRFIATKDAEPIDTLMVAPDFADAKFSTVSDERGHGIASAEIGSVLLDQDAKLSLYTPAGARLFESEPIGRAPAPDHEAQRCASQPGTDMARGTRAGAPRTVADEAACCAACKSVAGCSNWIYGHPGDQEGNCWVMASIDGTTPAPTRTLGGAVAGGGLRLSTKGGKLYGRGAGMGNALSLTATSVSASVANTAVYAPHYYSTDGYAALGVVPRNSTVGDGKTNELPVSYATDGSRISWRHAGGAPFELYLMPAASLSAGTAAYYRLVGSPVVPPRYAFGFVASRWGWQNSSYIEWVLQQFRAGAYPIDAIIVDFGWFTNVSDYGFPPEGVADYHDFGCAGCHTTTGVPA